MKLSSETKQEHRIIDETRRSIIDALLAMGSLTGDKEYHEFAKLVCPSLSEGTISEIARHMDRFAPLSDSIFSQLQGMVNQALVSILPTKEKDLFVVHPIAIYYGK